MSQEICSAGNAIGQTSANALVKSATTVSTIAATPTHITLASRRDVRTIVDWAEMAQRNAGERECREHFPISDQRADIIQSLVDLGVIGRELTHAELVHMVTDHDVWPSGSQAHCEFMGRVALAYKEMKSYNLC